MLEHQVKVRQAIWVLALFFFSGCATRPPLRPAILPSLAPYRLTIGSVNYLPSSIVTKGAKGRARWDQEAFVWSFSVGTHTLMATPYLPVVLVDGIPERLSSPPLFKEGELLLPEALWTRWIARWAALPPPVRPTAVPLLRRIVVDAGHGGHDPGAISRTGLREKSVTLDIARRLRELLTQEGFHVVMSRDGDRFIPLSRRSEIANREGGDLFVSIHANASRVRSVSGFEVYYLSEATDDHARALEAAENASLPSEIGKTASSDTEAIVWDLLYTEHRAESTKLASSICQGLKRQLPSQNRGVKSARFAVLKGTRMPAILIEVGFLSNSQEEARLRDPSYRQRLAEGITAGILSFRKAHESSS